MGWRELNGWLEVAKRQREGERASPESWAGTERDPEWDELRARRERLRGR